MPIYVYERPDGSRFELRQGFNDQSLTEDPVTGVPVRRIMQPAPIIFKGSGWYKTDSRTSGASKAETTTTDGAEKSTEKGAEKTETATTKEAVSEATAKTTAEIKTKAEKPATPAAAS